MDMLCGVVVAVHWTLLITGSIKIGVMVEEGCGGGGAMIDCCGVIKG